MANKRLDNDVETVMLRGKAPSTLRDDVDALKGKNFSDKLRRVVRAGLPICEAEDRAEEAECSPKS